MSNMQDAITFYEVWIAGNEEMEKYGIYQSIERAKEVAKLCRCSCAGTIYIEKVIRERVCDC